MASGQSTSDQVLAPLQKLMMSTQHLGENFPQWKYWPVEWTGVSCGVTWKVDGCQQTFKPKVRIIKRQSTTNHIPNRSKPRLPKTMQPSGTLQGGEGDKHVGGQIKICHNYYLSVYAYIYIVQTLYHYSSVIFEINISFIYLIVWLSPCKIKVKPTPISTHLYL